jgi:hypothetical protein
VTIVLVFIAEGRSEGRGKRSLSNQLHKQNVKITECSRTVDKLRIRTLMKLDVKERERGKEEVGYDQRRRNKTLKSFHFCSRRTNMKCRHISDCDYTESNLMLSSVRQHAG